MKKILYSVFMLATMVLAACSSEDTTEPDVKRGMVLKANVEDTNTRATFTDTEGTWKFAFATNDVVKVGNDKVERYYTFTNSGTQFASTDALQTTAAANWYAYFPCETIDLANQSGNFADIANKYALAGMTQTATTGSEGLTITMKAKAAVLCIVGVEKGEKLDIKVKTSDDMYVSGLAAVKNSANFSVQTSEIEVSLLSKQDAGVYYVVVPAGVKLSVYNGSKLMKTTQDAGLKAGKYYTLLTGKTTGDATNSLGETINWVQLWAGGPKFATKNVATKMTFNDATKTGDAYVWGKNWRTPTKEEMTLVNATLDGNFYSITPLHAKCQIAEESGVAGLRYTGNMPGYTNQTIFLPIDGDKSYFHGVYWTSTSEIETHGTTLNVNGGINDNVYVFTAYHFDSRAYTTPTNAHFVRPVLNEKR